MLGNRPDSGVKPLIGQECAGSSEADQRVHPIDVPFVSRAMPPADPLRSPSRPAIAQEDAPHPSLVARRQRRRPSLCTAEPPRQLRFVDLFAGLGGFNIALSRLGHRCVFAAEIDPDLRALYERNLDIRPASDIRDCWSEVPEHDVLCAGFPCQPFSKAGSQLGFECPDSGNLFDHVLQIIDQRTPPFVLFENVSNILRHSGGKTWERIRSELATRGYAVQHRELSPHLLGVPQVRHRAIIVASAHGLDDFEWPEEDMPATEPLADLLDAEPTEGAPISTQHVRYLDVWEEFLECIGNDHKMPSFPIWAMEFGADYPCSTRNPSAYAQRYLARFRGAFGVRLAGKTPEEQIAALPTYARGSAALPRWKVKFIEQNREFYARHETRLRDWLPKVRDFPTSFQKLEWNWQAGSRTVWDKVLQFRASGIRVKNPATAPSLVALTSSQVPIVASRKRYLSPRECAKLQSLDALTHLPASKVHAYRALGNAVNAEVIYRVAANLIGNASDCASAARDGATHQRPTARHSNGHGKGSHA